MVNRAKKKKQHTWKGVCTKSKRYVGMLIGCLMYWAPLTIRATNTLKWTVPIKWYTHSNRSRLSLFFVSIVAFFVVDVIRSVFSSSPRVQHNHFSCRQPTVIDNCSVHFPTLRENVNHFGFFLSAQMVNIVWPSCIFVCSACLISFYLWRWFAPVRWIHEICSLHIEFETNEMLFTF